MAWKLMAKRLRKCHGAIREFLSRLPQVINDSVRPSCCFRHLRGLVGRQVKNLDTTCRNFDLMVMEMTMPLNGRELSGEVFGHEIFDRDEFRFWICGLKQEALKNLVRNAFAIVVVRATRLSVRHQMGRLDVNIESIDR